MGPVETPGMVELHAYGADCLVFGAVGLEDARLSDQLNRTNELRILDVRIEDLVDGHVIEMPELVVAHDELCAVWAAGPRGDIARRLTTRTARVEIEIGPYRVEGRVHGPPGGNPFASVLRRGTWVPLTDSVVTYRRGEEDAWERIATLLVNRHLMLLFREL
ncbi:MAG TPA: hypothetical protein VF375_05545 [Candidatus Limnocylindrales bacterium]